MHTRDSKNLTTIEDAIRWCAGRLESANLCFGHGTDNAIDEAVALTLFATKIPYQNLEPRLVAGLSAEARQRMTELLDERIRTRKPLPYLTNRAWFAGLEFYVDERVLVPRSPLAELAERGFTPWIDSGSIGRVLDLCTGSACIAIACASALPSAQIDATDLSRGALEVAAINRARHGLQERLRLIRSDLFGALQPVPYDVIVTNPPYVGTAEYAALPAEYRHEPAVGLQAGSDGLDLVHGILADAARFLTRRGILVVEVGETAAKLEQAYPQVPFTWLEFDRGGSGVFLLSAAELQQYESCWGRKKED